MDIDIWIGLDIGERRIGVAKSDALGITAQPHSFIERVGGSTDLEQIVSVAKQHEATGFVIGLPLRTDGSRGPEVEKVEQFADALHTLSQLPIAWVDERFTTVIALRALRDQGIKGQAQRRRVDQVAAALILQAFLDRRQNDGER